MRANTHITDFLELSANEQPATPALITTERTLTWAELWRETLAAAQALARVVPVDQPRLVGLLMPNSWEYVVAYLAIIYAGHTAVPIDVIYKPLEIEAIARQIPTELILVDVANLERLKTDTPTMTLAQLNARPPTKNFQPLRLPADEQIATIFFTSGTTGKPKAVPNTHANHLWNIKVCSEVWNWNSDDTLLISVRLHHMLGSVMGLSGVIYHGNTFYLTDRFNAEEILNLLESKAITMFSHGPLVYSKMLEFKKNYDLSRVRLFISGSGPLAPSTWQAFKERYGHEILEVYGSSETGRIASNLLNERIPGSPGRPLPGVDIKIDNSGELLVKSGGVFPGYYQNEELTKKYRTTDGFWRTGDIAELKDGRIILKGRLQEIIRRQGYTISPRDIEWALRNQPDLEDVAVLGIQKPGEINDELVYYIVGGVSEHEIRNFSNENLPSIWRPDKIIKISQLPRTGRGKININKLKAMV